MVVLALCLIVGCSGMMQNIGARWVTRQVAAEFDLDEPQRDATRASVKRLIDIAPDVLGPRLDVMVATADRAIADGLTQRDLRGLERQLDALLDDVAGHIIEEAAPILATLRDAQIDHAAARFETRFTELREKLDQPAGERLEQRQEKFIAAIEQWTGELSTSQKDALRDYAARLPDDGRLRLEADEARVNEVEAALRAHAGSASVRGSLWKAWKEREDWGQGAPPASERRAQDRDTLLYVYKVINDGQRAHVREHLHDLHAKLKRFLGRVDS